MKRAVVCVRDSAVGAFATPVYVPAVGVALRSFTDEVNRSAPENQLFAHPDDFMLYHLADFDEESGVFSVPDEGVRVLARGKDVKQNG